MIPYPLGITRKKIKNKIKIGVGLFPTYYGKGRGSLLPGATHCTVLHCTASRKQKTDIKTRGKQQSSSSLLQLLLLISIHLL
jgi:hypothetical protein